LQRPSFQKLRGEALTKLTKPIFCQFWQYLPEPFIWAVFENTQLASDLIEAAMKVCDRHGDGEAARQEMRQQCLELPPHLQSDLLEHFKGSQPTYPITLIKLEKSND
jgi:hypothetical protein